MDEMNWKPNSKDVWLSAGVVILVVAAFLLNPETIPAGNGFGFDGMTYAGMVADLDRMIANGELSSYYAQRVLPSFLVRTGLISLGLPLDADHIIAGFRVLNVLLIAACVGFWAAIARHLDITRAAYWIGIAGLLLIFPNARQALYYPVTTDTLAFLIGLALVWAQVTGRLGFLAALAIVGSLAWQVSGLVGTLLLLSHLVVPEAGKRPILDVPARVRRMTLLAIGVFATLLMGAVGLAYAGHVELDLVPFANGLSYDPSLRFLTNIPMLAVVSAFLALLCLQLLATGWRIVFDVRRTALILGLVAAVQLVPGMIVREISNPALLPPGIVANGYAEILEQLLVLRAREKLLLLPLVAHAVYYGPVFLLLVVLWRQVVLETVRFGAGFVVVMALFAGLSVFAESRFTFMFWPFVVTVVAKAMSAERPGKVAFLVFAVATLYFSKLWLRLNQAEWPLPDMDGLFEWPKSVYFSHLGPFMNGMDYVRQGLFVGLTFLLLLIALRKAGIGRGVSPPQR